MEQWQLKHKPKKSNKFIGYEKQIKEIKNWLENKKKKKNLIVIGKNGCGKTSFINILLNENNYDLINIFKFDLKKKSINDIYYKNNKKKIIIIDNLESIILKKEKDFIKNFLKNKNKYPIIFISNSSFSKFILDIKSKCKIINLWSLNNWDVHKIMNGIIKKEKIKLYNDDIKQDIVDDVNGDIRRLINILYDLKYLFNNKEITYILYDKYMYSTGKKDINMNIFETTTHILNLYNDLEYSQNLYKLDKNLPLMIYKNYINHILLKFIKQNDKLDIIFSISNFISFSDIIYNHIYSDQEWFMEEFYSLISCSIPSFLINCKQKIKKYEKIYHFNQNHCYL